VYNGDREEEEEEEEEEEDGATAPTCGRAGEEIPASLLEVGHWAGKKGTGMEMRIPIQPSLRVVWLPFLLHRSLPNPQNPLPDPSWVLLNPQTNRVYRL
jgi:hypothetical protein